MIRNKGAAVAWWRRLQPNPAEGRSGDRGALARLRRCATVFDAMQMLETITLFRACEADHADDLVDLALVAIVLAHVREDRPELKVARQIGPRDNPGSTETALVKPLRFQRLMTAATPDERLAGMRRLVALAGGKLNVRDLSDSLLHWTDETRRRWTYEYWGAGLPASLITSTTDQGKDTAA